MGILLADPDVKICPLCIHVMAIGDGTDSTRHSKCPGSPKTAKKRLFCNDDDDFCFGFVPRLLSLTG